jgi:hypothetical protein
MPAATPNVLFHDLPVLTVQPTCAPKKMENNTNTMHNEEEDDGPPTLSRISDDCPAKLPRYSMPTLGMEEGGKCLLSDSFSSPSSSGYASGNSSANNSGFFVPSTAAFRSHAMLSLPTMPKLLPQAVVPRLQNDHARVNATAQVLIKPKSHLTLEDLLLNDRLRTSTPLFLPTTLPANAHFSSPLPFNTSVDNPYYCLMTPPSCSSQTTSWTSDDVTSPLPSTNCGRRQSADSVSMCSPPVLELPSNDHSPAGDSWEQAPRLSPLPVPQTKTFDVEPNQSCTTAHFVQDTDKLSDNPGTSSEEKPMTRNTELCPATAKTAPVCDNKLDFTLMAASNMTSTADHFQTSSRVLHSRQSSFNTFGQCCSTLSPASSGEETRADNITPPPILTAYDDEESQKENTHAPSPKARRGKQPRRRPTRSVKRLGKSAKTIRKKTANGKPNDYASNWTPISEGEYRPVIVSTDAPKVNKLCYDALEHNTAGVLVRIGDRVRVRSDEDAENIAHVLNLYYDDVEATLMASAYWYYTSDQVGSKRAKYSLGKKEVMASRHVDIFSVDAIEAKVYVLTYNEYCRYRKELRGSEWPLYYPCSSANMICPSKCATYPRDDKLPTAEDDPDFVYFCRTEYDAVSKKIANPLKPSIGRVAPKMAAKRS